jgi:ketosteroid isomerase-like protein
VSLSAGSASLLVLGAARASCAGPQPWSSPPRDPDAAIRSAVAATATGWHRGDLDRYVSAYADSVTSAGPDGFVTGKAAAAAVMRSGFWRNGRPPQQLGYDHLVIRSLGADHALVTGRYLLTGAGQPERTGWFTTVRVRSASGWRMMHDHS